MNRVMVMDTCRDIFPPSDVLDRTDPFLSDRLLLNFDDFVDLVVDFSNDVDAFRIRLTVPAIKLMNTTMDGTIISVSNAMWKNVGTHLGVFSSKS